MNHTLEKSKSQRIKFIRVISICCITYVHLQPAQNYIDSASDSLNIFRYFLIIIAGSASVPILSIISGYLFYEIHKGTDWASYVRKRFFSIYVPMVIWCLIVALSLYMLNFFGYGGSQYERLLSMSFADSIFAISDRPINYPLYFLRDVFIISIFAPLLKYFKFPFGIEILLFICLLFYFLNIGYPIIIRPMTLLFFVFGVYLSMRQIDLCWMDRNSALIIIVVSVIILIVSIYDLNSRPLPLMFQTSHSIDLFYRISLSVLIWTISIVVMRGNIWKFIRFAEFRIYTMFLSHILTIIFLGGLFQVIFGEYNGPEYFLFFTFAPVYCFVGASAIYWILSFLPKRISHLIIGK